MSIKQLAMVKTILGFRQQEFIHEGLRWFDIRRFYISVKRASKYKFYKQLEKETRESSCKYLPKPSTGD